MALSIPSIKDSYNKIKASIYSFTKGLLEVEKDPFVRAMTETMSKITDHVYKTAQDSISQTFSQTVTDEGFMKAIAFDKTNNVIQRKEAEKANGQLIVISSQSVDIPSETQFITSDGQIYQSQSLRTAITQEFIITSLIRDNGYAIATLADHNFASNIELEISGAIETSFNGVQKIEVLTKDTFRYLNSGANESASGTIKGSFLGCRVDVQSVNAEFNANKTFSDTIALAQNLDFIVSSNITFNGITRGKDIETLLNFRSRIIEFLATPQNKGNLSQHRTWIKQNTDANYVYFFTSEDSFYIYLNGIISKRNSDFSFTNFTVDELLAIKNNFVSQNQLLLGVDALQLTLSNPTFVNINVTIVDLSPDTLEMKNKITLVLKEYISLLPIKKYLASGLPEISASKLESVVALVRDSNGATPSITSLTVSGGAGLDSDVKKPILGTITFS